jgi:hypothetical protein
VEEGLRPEPPAVSAVNWLRTVPGKSWFPILRLYGPLEAWFDQTWRPGELHPTEPRPAPPGV